MKILYNTNFSPIKLMTDVCLIDKVFTYCDLNWISRSVGSCFSGGTLIGSSFDASFFFPLPLGGIFMSKLCV